MLSRGLGLVRDMLVARVFGAGMSMDAFVLAFTVPNLFRRLFGEGALSAAFIPVFTEKLQKSPTGPADSPPESAAAETAARTHAANRLFSLCATALVIVLGGAVLLGWGICRLAPAVTELSEKAALFVGLLNIMLPYVLLICLAALFSAALQVHRRFGVPALMPVVLNVCWIAGIFLLCPGLGIYGMAVAILVGGLLQVGLQMPALARRGTRLRPEVDLRDPDLRRVVRLMLPVMLGLAVLQINVVIDRLIVELCVPGHGGNSALYFGNRLVQFPLGVFGIAMATAIFPSLSSAAVAGDRKALTHTLQQALRITLFISLPAVAVAAALREPIVSLFFEGGSFHADATARTASVLMFYSLGLWAYCSVHIVTRAFYAQQDTRTPVRIAVAMVILNLALNLTLVWPMRESGLALATAVTSAVNLAILLVILRRRIGRIRGRALAASGLRSLAASGIVFVACRYTLSIVDRVWSGPGLTYRLAAVFLPMLAGGVLFLTAACVLRMREPRELRDAFARKSGRPADSES